VPRRQDQDRRRVAVGLRHAAEGVLGARPELHGEHADASARGHPTHGVGHVQAGSLLAHDDGANARLGRGLEDRVARVTDQVVDALALEDLRDGAGDLHRSPRFADAAARWPDWRWLALLYATAPRPV